MGFSMIWFAAFIVHFPQLAFISAGWTFVFPELPGPAAPAHEVASILKLAHVDMILEALTG